MRYLTMSCDVILGTKGFTYANIVYVKRALRKFSNQDRQRANGAEGAYRPATWNSRVRMSGAMIRARSHVLFPVNCLEMSKRTQT